MLGNLLKPEFDELILSRDWNSLREAFTEMDPADVAEVIEDLPAQDSGVLFRLLPRDKAALVFEYLPPLQQSEVVSTLATEELKNLLNEMAPDDRTRLLEELPAEVTRRALTSLSPAELKVARQLLGYPEKSAGRYMTPEYLTLPGNLSAAEALSYVRAHGQGRETLSVLYIVDEKGRLLDEVRLASLVLSQPDTRVTDIHDRQLVSIPATVDREEIIGFFEKYDRVVLPVTDSQGVLLGIITVDDVLDVAEEAATEDIQRMGGMEALEAPYLESGLLEMLHKRVGWLTLLFLGQMFTATAMAHYQDAIAQAVFLGTFVPLIISSGGNSGSQATSLIIRALAVRDVALQDWWRVALRESVSGVALGVFLGVLGALRIALWPGHEELYGPHFLWVGVAVGLSVLGVVTFGTLCGSMLPFLLRRLGLDPATASAPFVATLVDVTGVVIYFTVASTLLAGLVF
ncbi:magnesium transporter [Stigmatella aurantiaca]|uniref:Magnesium transporter MgtE n=1 Tax=Stigmatella aurantiaca (strain DW4/3-1) TaxID=378806 RepID=Q08TP7_STIAD|nr:magnesium transporter [Stigmatella aurantiaca]ADO71175.1 Magnesium transporter [Stigmatella aurantiaca DW4/3-1]EAU63858.1 magnesium transporter [Stigmatella aurantiaca DW4/3-1]